MASPFSSKLGTSQSVLGGMVLGDPGYSGSLVQTPTSTLATGTFKNVVPTRTTTAKVVSTTTPVSTVVNLGRKFTNSTLTIVKFIGLNVVPTTVLVQARFLNTTPVSTLVLAHRGPIVIPNTVSIFPTPPLLYQGGSPKPSSLLLDSISLLPTLYNTDPDEASALTVKSISQEPPVSATSNYMASYNPKLSPVVVKIDNVNANLGAGRYEIVYTFRNDNGETAPSPKTIIDLDKSQGEGIQLLTPSIPSDMREVRYYLRSPLSDTFTLVAARFDSLPFILTTFGQTITARVEGTLFEVVSVDNDLPIFSCDLRDFTLSSLAYQLELAGYIANVISGWENYASTILLDQFLGPAPSITVKGFTSTLWRIIRPLALCFDQWSDDLSEGVRQLDVRYAAGRWLDWWGVLYGVPRVRYESDDQYRRRITWEVMGPRANGTAMEVLLKEALGYDSSITDATGHAQTWYSNRNPVGAPLRDPTTGLATVASTDTQGRFTGNTLSWDANAVYNAGTFTWTQGDTSTLTWGLTNPTAVVRPNPLNDGSPSYFWGSRLKDVQPTGPLVDPQNAPVTWPGITGKFQVFIRQVVENGQLGVQEITQLINRYKAAGYLFSLSLATHYSELFDIASVKENNTESWQEAAYGPVGTYYTTMTMASLTMSFPPPPAREATCYEEWSIDGATFTPWGTTLLLRDDADPEVKVPLGLGGIDHIVPLAAPGIVPLG